MMKASCGIFKTDPSHHACFEAVILFWAEYYKKELWKVQGRGVKIITSSC